MPASPFLLSLHNGWEFFAPDQSAWLSAEVPGCIHKDLLCHGLIPDPFYGRNEAAVAWVGERDWCYRLRFSPGQEIFSRENLELVLDGLDTVATVTLNGLEILQSDNMFHAHRVPVRDALCAGENVLEITFGSAAEYVAQHRPLFKSPQNFNDPSGQAVRIRKQACQFGWDWGPRLITAGIWRGVRLEGWSANRIETVRIVQNHGEGFVELAIFPELAGAQEGVVFRSTVSLGGEEVAICQGTKLTAVIPNPQLWWPSGQGEQPLYEVRVELLENEVVIDTWVRRIGLRRIELDRGPDEFSVENSNGQPLNRFGFRVNGRLIFAKGANWIPAHSFVHGLERSDYAPLLNSAVEANMNMIRLWGGGIYEHDCFYDLCDELGLLVWHDFMFACDLYPSDDAFLASIKREAEENVRRVRHHASLALWCGNNEIVSLNANSLAPGGGFVEGYEKLFHRLLPEVVERLDGVTTYLPSSPDHALPQRSDTQPPSHDEHDWNVWHARLPVEHYETTRHRFCSEFGMQSYPSQEVAESFCPAGELNTFSPTFENHQKHPGGNLIIFEYLSRLFRFPKDYRATAYLSQLNQAWCMRVAVEHWRRISPLCLGAVYWQLNDCWPVASWSSLEFGGKWKALQFEAKRFFAPELVSIRHLGAESKTTGNILVSTTGPVEIHVVQDTPQPRAFTVRRRLCLLDGAVLNEQECRVQTEPQRGLLVESVDFTELLAKHGRDNVYLRVDIEDHTGSPCARTFSFFTAPRSLNLKTSPIKSDWEQINDTDFQLSLTSDAFHFAVCLELENEKVKWSDNFFHLPAGEVKRVLVRCSGKVPKESLARLHTYSLVQSYLS